METPDVSVLIPAYNCELTLARAVASVLSQPSVQTEVIIINDCSTDNTGLLADELSQIYPNVRVIHRSENGRIAAALNSGGAVARGRYFMRLDSDDWLESGALAKLAAALESGSAGFAYGGRRYYGRRSDVYLPKPFHRDDFNVHNASGYAYMFRREVWDMGIRWNALGTFGDAIIDMEDWQHIHAMLAAGFDGVALTDTIVLHYTFRWDGTWQELQANKDAALAEFKRRYPSVRASAL